MLKAHKGYSIRFASRILRQSNMSNPDFDRPLAEQDENLAWSQPRPWAPYFTGWWAHVYRSDTWKGPDIRITCDFAKKSEEETAGHDVKNDKGSGDIKIEEGGHAENKLEEGALAEIKLEEGGHAEIKNEEGGHAEIKLEEGGHAASSSVRGRGRSRSRSKHDSNQ